MLLFFFVACFICIYQLLYFRATMHYGEIKLYIIWSLYTDRRSISV